MKKAIAPLVLLFLIFFTLSCNKSDNHPATISGGMAFRLEFEEPSDNQHMPRIFKAASPDICVDFGISTIVATVYDSSSTSIAALSFLCSAHTGSLNVTVATEKNSLVVEVEGRDISGTALWRGNKTGIVLTQGQTTDAGAVPMSYVGNDYTSPSVLSYSPSALNVPVTSTITVTFSEAMMASSITNATFFLRTQSSSSAISGAVNYDSASHAAYFKPASNLAYSTAYVAYLDGGSSIYMTYSNGISDMAGRGLSDTNWYFITEAAPTGAPTAPTGVSTTSGNGTATLTWPAVSDATAYNIYWATANWSATKANGTRISGATSPYMHTGLTNGQIYYYVVTALNGNGESAESSKVTATPVAPITAAPTGLTATPGDGQVSLNWPAVTGATSYNVYWSTSSGVTTANGIKISGVTSIPYTHAGLANGTSFYYIVTSVNTGGESAASNEVKVTPQLRPSAPTGVVATAGDGQITLSWDAVTGATSYNLYWSTTNYVTKTTGTKITGATSPYTHTGLPKGTVYYYVATADTGGVESTESGMVSALPEAYTITYHVPDTNQTTVYQTGDDGTYLINPPSYTDNGDGTITDVVTGLVWQKQDDATTRTWDSATTYCAGLALPGTGWRLPTVYELETIVDFGINSPAITTTYFPNTQSLYYWSITTCVIPTYAWGVDFSYGSSNYYSKANSAYVRCVR